jgi:signal peptide peptidase SppA, 67K type
MKDFFKMMFASTLGVIIASIILTFLSFIMFIGMASVFSSTPTFVLEKNSVLRIDLKGVISEREKQDPFSFLLSNSIAKNQGLNEILDAIKKAKDNEKIKGIYLKAEAISSGYATMEPIREALQDFKDSGKFIVAYGETVSQRSYYIASLADKFFINPQGHLELIGLGSTRQYSKEVFQKWGIDIQVFKVGTYKSAVEPYTQTQMSEANREQVSSYLNDIWGRFLKDVSESRSLTTEQLNAYVDECLIFSSAEALVERGLVDELGYASDVEKYLKSILDLEEKDKLKIATVKDMVSVPDTKKKLAKDKIAVLYAEGEIIADGTSIYGNNTGITAKEFVSEFRKLQDDDQVKAVVFRVNSPGGSAYASEQIWRALTELKEKKPVVVSMGDYAASGGYYISCNATKIVAQPNTLTGSIGIFGLIPSGEQLAKKMGAHFDGVGTNKHTLFGGGVLSIPFIELGLLPARMLNADESKMLQTYIEKGYDDFIGRCADGRGKTKVEIDQIGQGRVWTGNQALELGLVDELGDLQKAIEIAADEAELEDYSISNYPAQKDFFTQLLEESMGGAKIRFIKAIMGKEEFLLKQELNAWRSFDFRQAIMEDYLY